MQQVREHRDARKEAGGHWNHVHGHGSLRRRGGRPERYVQAGCRGLRAGVGRDIRDAQALRQWNSMKILHCTPCSFYVTVEIWEPPAHLLTLLAQYPAALVRQQDRSQSSASMVQVPLSCPVAPQRPTSTSSLLCRPLLHRCSPQHVYLTSIRGQCLDLPRWLACVLPWSG